MSKHDSRRTGHVFVTFLLGPSLGHLFSLWHDLTQHVGDTPLDGVIRSDPSVGGGRAGGTSGHGSHGTLRPISRKHLLKVLHDQSSKMVQRTEELGRSKDWLQDALESVSSTWKRNSWGALVRYCLTKLGDTEQLMDSGVLRSAASPLDAEVLGSKPGTELYRMPERARPPSPPSPPFSASGPEAAWPARAARKRSAGTGKALRRGSAGTGMDLRNEDEHVVGWITGFLRFPMVSEFLGPYSELPYSAENMRNCGPTGRSSPHCPSWEVTNTHTYSIRTHTYSTHTATAERNGHPLELCRRTCCLRD